MGGARWRLGSSLVGACDVIDGSAASAAEDVRDAWIRHELLEPLAARLSRAGYAATFDPALVAWLDRYLPSDGTPPEAFLDQAVTARIASQLPAPGPLTVGIADDLPAVVAGATSTG